MLAKDCLDWISFDENQVMTSPIKPPGGKPPIPQNPAVDQVNKGDKGGFSDAVKAAEAAEASAVGTSAQTPSAEVGADGVAARLQSGEIDAATAVEELVQRALQTPSVQGLSPDARADLEATLRATIANDPTFATLQKDLDR